MIKEINNYHYVLAGQDKHKFKRKIKNIFLLIIFNICLEYPQRMLGLRNKKNNF